MTWNWTPCTTQNSETFTSCFNNYLYSVFLGIAELTHATVVTIRPIFAGWHYSTLSGDHVGKRRLSLWLPMQDGLPINNCIAKFGYCHNNRLFVYSVRQSMAWVYWTKLLKPRSRDFHWNVAQFDEQIRRGYPWSWGSNQGKVASFGLRSAISRKQWEIELRLQLITDRKWAFDVCKRR